MNLDYTFRNLQTFPENLCAFPLIKIIRLSGNLLTDIPALSCLPSLEILLLARNKISALKKVSLIHNKNLKYVDLSYNLIAYIETGVLELSSFHTIILKGNFLMSLDVRDFAIVRPFCLVDLSYNKLEVLVNNYNWTVNKSVSYSGGFINATHNNIRELPHWRKVGFPDLTDIGKIIYFGIDIRYNPITCDCKLAEPMAYFKPLTEHIDRNYFYMFCQSPPALNGSLLINFLEGDRISELICDYTGQPLCPQGCSCLKSPRYLSAGETRLVFTLRINCSQSNIQRLPHILPETDEIEFYLRGSAISHIKKEHYLSRVSVVELPIVPSFEHGALGKMNRLKEFSVPKKSQLDGIPREFSCFDPCIFLQKQDFTVNCTCSHVWMHDWLITRNHGNCSTGFAFKCARGISAEEMIRYIPQMDCQQESDYSIYILLLYCSFLIICIALFAAVVYRYKYEIRLFYRTSRACERSPSQGVLDQDSVVFVSYDEENQDLHSWILKTLEPFLLLKGFHVFLPTRDLPLGSVRSDEIAWQISVSRFYIVHLSVNYLNEDSLHTYKEWNCIWESYLADSRKRLLVINYDLIDAADISCNKMRSILHAGDVVNFSRGENSMFSKISKTLR
ncbi:uncharacterized protein LOC133197875 [Saccostrea echinata]|uniref:uncharacterized protein LOC133197875 n=1 Tax=Saccostrea echinata TaxID=191078 RepID=UPI002A833CBC|nr:uncharacterized protein LOC133197875 [Saccostrea echinata]